MMFSQYAWQQSSSVYKKIQAHSFNLELVQGTLLQEKFMYYIEQDSIYLRDFTRCHALLAVRCEFNDAMIFLRFAQEASVAEQELVHQFFREKCRVEKQGGKTSALLAYTNFLLRTCALDSVEVAAAALLPCFMVYQQLGVWMSNYKISDAHPYSRWIEVYSSELFLKSVQAMQGVVDRLALSVSAATHQLMLNAFHHSICLEWHFWNDAYALQRFDVFHETNDGIKSFV